MVSGLVSCNNHHHHQFNPKFSSISPQFSYFLFLLLSSFFSTLPYNFSNLDSNGSLSRPEGLDTFGLMVISSPMATSLFSSTTTPPFPTTESRTREQQGLLPKINQAPLNSLTFSTMCIGDSSLTSPPKRMQQLPIYTARSIRTRLLLCTYFFFTILLFTCRLASFMGWKHHEIASPQGSLAPRDDVDLKFGFNKEDRLNNRFKEIKDLKSDAIFSIDDDVIFPCSPVEFAFNV